jgi:hypothetical protein
VPAHSLSSRSLAALGAAVIVSAVAAAPAAANHSLQAVATLTTGYTDNVQLVPDNPTDPNVTATVTSDAFANIAPGMIFAHEGHRITQVLRYTLSIRLYAEQSSANSFSNSLNYGVIIPLTPRAGMTFDVTGSHGRLNAFDLAPQQAQAGQAQGDQSFATGAGTIGYSYQLTPSWSYGQTIGASIYEPLDETVQIGRRTTTDASLSLNKTFNFNAFTFSARASYSTVEAGDSELGAELEDTSTVLAGPELRWVHDLTTDFSTDASVGATVTFPPDEFENRQTYPVGAFYLRYTHDRYAASLGYRRTVLTNLQLGETTATHVGEARGVIPLPFGDTLSLEGALIYSNGESVGRRDAANNEVELDTIAYIGDLALGWRLGDGLSTGLRYQYTRQNRDSLPMMGEVGPGDVERTRRQQIMLTLEGTYPSRQAVELPRDSSTRVDAGLESMSKREESLVR